MRFEFTIFDFSTDSVLELTTELQKKLGYEKNVGIYNFVTKAIDYYALSSEHFTLN